MLFWKGHAFLDPLFPCNIWLLGCSLSQRIWVHRYDTLDTRCMWRVHAYFLEYLWHKSQKYHNSIILNHMNTCTLARFQCIYAWFAFSIAKASKASKLLCRAFGPKCEYDGDIFIWYFVHARMCVVQALLALGFISSLRQRGTSQLFGGCVCNMHSVLCSMLLVFLFLFSKFLAFSWTILVSMFLVSMFLVFPEKFMFRCFLFFSEKLSFSIPELFSTRRVVRLNLLLKLTSCCFRILPGHLVSHSFIR